MLNKKLSTILKITVLFFVFSSFISVNLFSQTTHVLDNTVYSCIKKNIRKVKKENILKKIEKIQRLKKENFENVNLLETSKGNAFYPVNASIDISGLNGKTENMPLDKKEIRNVSRLLEKYRKDDASLSCFKIADTYAYEWWIKNFSINYNPLIITLVDYYNVDLKEKIKKGNKKQFFAMYPFDTTMQSQIITFGFEQEFYHGNDHLKVDNIILTHNGKKYTLGPSSCVPILFDSEGQHTVYAVVQFNDNSSYETSFRIQIKTMSDRNWFNSIVDSDGKVKFRTDLIQ